MVEREQRGVAQRPATDQLGRGEDQRLVLSQQRAGPEHARLPLQGPQPPLRLSQPVRLRPGLPLHRQGHVRGQAHRKRELAARQLLPQGNEVGALLREQAGEDTGDLLCSGRLCVQQPALATLFLEEEGFDG